MKLDFVIPASPTPAFFSQVAMFRLSLDRLGGYYRDARLVVVFGDHSQSELPAKWRPYFERVEIAWASPDEFERQGYAAQGDKRYEVMRLDADLIVFCDADTIMVRRFGRDVLSLARREAIGGVIAHYHFPWHQSSGNAVADWKSIAHNVTGSDIQTPYRYTLLDKSKPGECPFYINLGFLVGSPEMLLRLRRACQPIRSQVQSLIGNTFCAQVTLAIAINRHRIPAVALPMRYNFPNDPIADQRYPFSLWRVSLLHYLRNDLFDRHRIFASAEDFEMFLNQNCKGSNRVLQETIRVLTGGRYPFALR